MMLAILYTNYNEHSAFALAALDVMWLIGVLALSVCYALVRLAEARGWRFVARLVPAICVALILTGLAVAEQRGLLRVPAPRQVAQRQPVYTPYCEDWWSYLANSLCWFQN